MKVAVVFYSRFGHTRIIAQEFAQELGAELREIQTVKEHGWGAMALASIFGMTFKLRPMDLDFTPFDRSPVSSPERSREWAWSASTFRRSSSRTSRTPCREPVMSTRACNRWGAVSRRRVPRLESKPTRRSSPWTYARRRPPRTRGVGAVPRAAQLAEWRRRANG